MKCLIVKKEWLDLILSGEKVWEMRSRMTKVRGRIGLIESGSGLIVGECELTGCSDLSYTHPENIQSIYHLKHRVLNPDQLKRWNKAWRVKKAKRYDKPIPYKHPQGAVVWVNVEGEG